VLQSDGVITVKNNESITQTLNWEDYKDFDKRELFDFLLTRNRELKETEEKYNDLLNMVFERDDELYRNFLKSWGVEVEDE
jgi:hypothetical protein